MASIIHSEEANAIQSTLQLDPNQPGRQPPPAPRPQAQHRKRKKIENGAEASSSTEPRRLRRSHEACSRCRSKKIKCDSKHPRCTACATAGTPCEQEDRHRQTLTPRGYTERIELQLAQCDALLKHHIQDFDLNNLDDFLTREGVDVHAITPNLSNVFQLTGSPSNRGPPSPDGKPYQYPPQAQLMPPGYPMMPYGPPGASYALPLPVQSSSSGGGPHSPPMHPAPFQHPPQATSTHSMPPPPVPSRVPVVQDIRGQDPQYNDMSSSQSLVKGFGITPFLDDARLNSHLGGSLVDSEDIGLGSNELTSGRDHSGSGAAVSVDLKVWFKLSLPKGSADYMGDEVSPISVWLPKDRKMVKHIVDVYFTRLNIHRPVFVHEDFENALDSLYEGRPHQQEEGFYCSLYLILALGTLTELNDAMKQEDASSVTRTPRSKLHPDWPSHTEFFAQAMANKSHLQVSIVSLQALILFHWYLYTERHGRTLWRLVGSLVRIAIELGLQHDPFSQGGTFTDEECRLRINLWAIVMIHDRGTSLLLGRPLAIAPSDSNTPRPSGGKLGPKNDLSEHFLFSSDLAEIQADIINSLYTPTRQGNDTMLRHTSRIMKSMIEFRRRLPESYSFYFRGTEDWPLEKRVELVQGITEDQGLTLLKFGISRILLMRVLFIAKDLPNQQRHKALVDAIITSHNVIVIHHHLIRFPDIAFFVSPIPLHIAAMVILSGRLSRCDGLSKEMALEDVWTALEILPRLRWRWERKDSSGGHPLISKLAERLFGTNFQAVGHVNAAVLLPELDWDGSPPLMSSAQASALPPSQQQHNTSSPYTGGGESSHPRGSNGSRPRGVGSAPPTGENLLFDVPSGLFYPFFPDNQTTIPPGRFEGGPTAAATSVANGELDQLLAAASAEAETGHLPSAHGTLMIRPGFRYEI